MKRWLLWAALAVIAVAAGLGDRTDIGKLQPVALLQLSREARTLVIETDTGDMGQGATLEEAFEDLKQSTPAAIFLETADYLLVTEDTRIYTKELLDFLRPGTEVLLISEPVDTGSAAKYLDNHRPGITLQELRYAQAQLPCLTMNEGRYALRN